MTNSITYRTIIEPDGKTFHGYVPALPGCHTCGKTITETQKHLQEAIELYIECLLKDRKPIPQDRSFESFQTVQIPKPPAVRKKRQYA